MINTTSSFLRRHWFSLVLFFALFVLFRIVPPVYDMWAGPSYYNSAGGIWNWIITTQKYFYNVLNGRISANFLSGIIEADRSGIAWDLMCAGTVVLIGELICRLFCIKYKKSITAFTVALFFMVSNATRVETLFYAFSTYIVPILLILLFLWCLKQYLAHDKRKWSIVLMWVSAFCLSTWVEHIAFGFICILGLSTLFIVIKSHMKHFVLWGICGISIVGGIVMMMAPGLRSSRIVVSQTAPLFEVIRGNLSYFVKYILFNNAAFFMLFFSALFFCVVGHKTLSLKRKILLGIADAICFCMFTALPIVSRNSITVGIFLAFVVVCILSSLWVVSNRFYCYFLIGLAGMATVVMMVTPNPGCRIFSIFYFALACILPVIADQILGYGLHWKKMAIAVVWAVVVLTTDQMILLGRRISTVQREREILIQEVRLRQGMNEWEESDVLILPYFKAGDIIYKGLVFDNTFHYSQFLDYYGLEQGTHLAYSNSPEEYFISD